MERKNLCPGLSSKKDEDNEKKNGRISLKKRKRVVDDKDENNLWRVKCGTKMGILHKEKMSKGEACIERKGSFYTPPEFEKLAGKEPCRKWKSSICHKGKTLRFWFKKGELTTTGYRQKKRKQQSSDLESHELSTEPKEDHDEDEDGEEDDEDMDEDNEPDTKKNEDEDATPIYIYSEEEESEEDLVEDEDGEQEDEDMDEDDVGDDQRSTEEYEHEEDDNDEDETVPAVASNNTDSSSTKERVTPTIPTPGKHALEMKEKIRHRPHIPRSEVSGNKRDVATNTAIRLQNVKKEPQDKLKKTTSSTISTPVKPALKIKEEKGVVNSLPEGLHNIKHLEKTRHHPEMPRSEVSGNKKDVAKNTAIKLQNVKKEPQDKLKKTTTSTISTPVKSALKGLHNIKHLEKTRHHPEMPRSEVSGNKKDVAKNTAIKLQNVKKEPQDKLSLSCEPLAVSDQQEHKAVHCSGHKVADLQPMRPEGGADMMEALSPKPSGSSGLNTVDLDELKREEIKMQLTVLKLKEEYYTLKIKELKK